MPNRRFARFAWVTLAYTVAVVLWGTIVRATGSGAGCGESWPLCNGRLVFGTPALAKLIELAHRSSSGIDGILIAVMAIWAFRAFPKRHPASLGARISLLLLVVEALLGAALVKFGLVGQRSLPCARDRTLDSSGEHVGAAGRDHAYGLVGRRQSAHTFGRARVV